jgi:hypothetical protein
LDEIGPVGIRRYGPAPRVLFVNDLWGYGTVTVAMAIADELDGCTRLFAGKGPGFELARRSSFDGLERLDTRVDIVSQELDRLLDLSQVVVSVMNPQVARLALQKGVHCVYVDCLTWMWAAPPPVPFGIPYFSEAFPGAAEKLGAWHRELCPSELVGPIVCAPAGRRPSFQDAVLVAFGGLSSWLNAEAPLITYAQMMAASVVEALARRGWDGRIVVTAGRHVLDRMDEAALRKLHDRVEVVDLKHDSYLAELRRSKVLFTSAGMHALYEAFAEGVPCVCLPSQNLSGALALRELRRSESAGGAVDWEDLFGPIDLDPAREADVIKQIDERILRFRVHDSARRVLTDRLAAAFDDDSLRELQEGQARFYAAQGVRGADRVAAQVRQFLSVAVPAVGTHATAAGDAAG